MQIVGRNADLAAVDRFLDHVGEATGALVVEGEPGIGKTTIWREALARAAERGFRVLLARPAEAEATLSYAALADLVGAVHDEMRADLPAPQQQALDVALLHTDAEGPADPRTTAMGFLGVLRALATESRSSSPSTTCSGSTVPLSERWSSRCGDCRRGSACSRRDGPTEPGTCRSASRAPCRTHGAWERVEGRLYASTIVFFRFDPQTGAYLGTQQVNSALRLAQDGESFTAVALSELRDPDGNVVASGLRASVVGQRIEVERIPDQP